MKIGFFRPGHVLHPVLGAKIMHRLFDRNGLTFWFQFTAAHSRSFAKFLGGPPSRLCYADKLSLCLTPTWLWVVSTWLSGESHYYINSNHCRLARPGMCVWKWLKIAQRDSLDFIKHHYRPHYENHQFWKARRCIKGGARFLAGFEGKMNRSGRSE